MSQPDTYSFSLTHIDVARNSTDDFNPFHDKTRWQQITNNPFGKPIALGFQQVAFIAHQISIYRKQHREDELLTKESLTYSHYQLNFASVLKAGDYFSFEIKKSNFKESDIKVLSNRFLIKNNGNLAMIGFKREAQKPLILENANFDTLPDIKKITDRTFIEGKRYFLKRKFLNTSNGKNFLVGSLVEQSLYFDELIDKVIFPESFTLALVSCALLERATHCGHDFLKNPMVYVSQQLCIDREINNRLKSNDALVMLVEKQETDDDMENYSCYGLLDNKTILFRCVISLAPLQRVIESQNNK